MAGTVGVHPTFVVVGAAFASTAALNWSAIPVADRGTVTYSTANPNPNPAGMLYPRRSRLPER